VSHGTTGIPKSAGRFNRCKNQTETNPHFLLMA